MERLRLFWLVWLLVGLLLAGCAAGEETAVSREPFIVPTPTPEPTTAVIIASILSEGTLEPTATPFVEVKPTKTPLPPTATPDVTADLRLGATPDQENCEWLTEAVAQVLEEDLGLDVAVLTFSNDEKLFASVAAAAVGTADLTLCYRDPDHRDVLQTYFGFVDFIGGAYWTNGAERLQVLAKTAVVIPLQTNHPCAYTFLQTLNLGTSRLTDQDINQQLSYTCPNN